MRCPKCRYISFDDGDRCRNCGYDFSLIPADPPLDLPIRSDEPIGPMADLRLTALQRRAAAAALTPPAEAELERPARQVTRNDERRDHRLTPGGFDLPLFNDARDDVPLVSANAPPRPPLAVRRAAPAAPRARFDEPVQEEPALEFPESSAPVRREPPEDLPRAMGVVDTEAIAQAGPRLLGAAIDALILGAIDAGVLYSTLWLCGLQLAEIRALPVVPMLAFLLMLNGGYVTMFTAAGGQTIGKMLAGTRVVPAAPAHAPRRLPFGTAVVRAAACLVSLVPAGAGFFMALVRADGRALHDAVADTRVIKA